MKNLHKYLKEVEKKYITDLDLKSSIQNGEIVLLKSIDNPIFVGKDLSIKINTSVGMSQLDEYDQEMRKIQLISESNIKPDLMMDLSIVKSKKRLYKQIQNTMGCPVGTIPHYLCFNNKYGIDRNELLEEIQKEAEDGVAFMTFHLTADYEKMKIALNRKVPIISRGGSIILRDMLINNRKQNILMENYNEILKILKKYNVVMSIGTTYRPSAAIDALDEVHLRELKMQKDIIKRTRKAGVNVILEGIGHASMKQIESYVNIMRQDIYIPFMPLGPIVTDNAHGWDHIVNAVGAAFMAYNNGADIINSVTREEHTGGIPTVDSILEAINAAHVVVKIIDSVRFFDKVNVESSQRLKNCLGKDDNIGCERCREECPFKLMDDYERIYGIK